MTAIRFERSGLIDALDELFSRFDGVWDSVSNPLAEIPGPYQCVVRSDLTGYLDLCRRAWIQEPVGRGAAATAPTRLLVGCVGESGHPALIWQLAEVSEREIERWLHGSPYHLHHVDGFWQLFDRSSRRGWQLMSRATGYPPWDPGSPLRNLLHWAMNVDELSLLHGGTLGLGETHVFLAGPGGSGKSGTVLAGVARGLTSLGDDYVGVDASQEEARALYRVMKQDPAGVQRLGLIGHAAVSEGLNWQGKYLIDSALLCSTAMQPACRLARLVFPLPTDRSRTTFVPMDEKAAFLRLAPSAVTQIPGDRSIQVRAAGTLVRRLPAYEMRLGRDPDEVIEALTRFLEAI